MLPPNKFIDINKTYQRLQGKDVITTPKTRKSKRKVPIPDFLCDELREFISTRYMITPDERLFPITKSYLSHEMIRGCKNTGVKNIRIHDIRHSHASLHINQGCDALILADRLGHEKVSTTLNTYSHLFPHKQQKLVNNLGNWQLQQVLHQHQNHQMEIHYLEQPEYLTTAKKYLIQMLPQQML